MLLSSIGAHHAQGNGPVDREHAFEVAFGAYANTTIVRAAYFVENWRNVLEPIVGAGILPTFLAPEVPIPMVGVDDIGAVVASALIEPPSSRIVELAGPEDVTPEEVAARFAEAVGRSVRLAPSPPSEAVPLVESLGFTGHVAELVGQMYRGYHAGTMAFEGSPTRSPTPLSQAIRSIVRDR
ncbi:MAG: hypothetical protein AAF602_24205 [Myxococcota bacterium]